MYIYKITNTKNGKIYIGKTLYSIEKRFVRHKQRHKKGNGYLYNSMRKHGPEHFRIEEIECVKSESILNEREKYWIARLNPEYNMTKGGDGGDTTARYTEERLKERQNKSSMSIKLMWENLDASEKSRRGKKTQQNTNQIEKGKKVSDARKRIFAAETEEEKKIRIEKAKAGAKKVVHPKCEFCDRPINVGNMKKHVDKCTKNPLSPTYGKRKSPILEYVVINPAQDITTFRGSIKKFCLNNNISYYLLKKHIGHKVEKLDERTNNANFMSYNTIGWGLLQIIQIER
jgi:group I intron endonuclease